MLRSALHLRGYGVSASDGELGKVEDLLFDDDRWKARYFVVDTGSWLSKRKIVISTEAITEPDWRLGVLHVGLTSEQVRSAPSIDEHEPISRKYEKDLFMHFGWPAYWWGTVPASQGEPGSADAPPDKADDETEHLRSAQEIKGYGIDVRDGSIGHVSDLIVDDEGWDVRYLIVDTGLWLRGRTVMIAPSWANSIDWAARTVSVSLTRTEVEESPEYDPSTPINREYEERLYDYYGRPRYWT